MRFEKNQPAVGDRIYTFQGRDTRQPQLILAEVVDDGGKALNVIEVVSGGRGAASPDDDKNLHMGDTGIWCHEKDGPLGHY